MPDKIESYKVICTGGLDTTENHLALADQNAGRSGIELPFFGLPCSTNPAPAIFSLRYNLRLHCCLCRRVGLGRWELELGPEISTHTNGNARSVNDIMSDINATYEDYIREDPANWFWVHNRWKRPDRAKKHSKIEHLPN